MPLSEKDKRDIEEAFRNTQDEEIENLKEEKRKLRMILIAKALSDLAFPESSRKEKRDGGDRL